MDAIAPNGHGIFRAKISNLERIRKMKISEKEIYILLRKLGTPIDLKGYMYIKEALLMFADSKDSYDLLRVTKRLYPELAKRFNDTVTRVERAIRHAITRTFDRLDLNVANEIFGNWDYNKPQPTNKQFFLLLLNI